MMVQQLKERELISAREEFVLVETDFKNLKKVRDDENEHKLLRATASFHYGVLRWDMNKRESAARSYRIGLEIINSLTESEKKLNSFLFRSTYNDYEKHGNQINNRTKKYKD